MQRGKCAEEQQKLSCAGILHAAQVATQMDRDTIFLAQLSPKHLGGVTHCSNSRCLKKEVGAFVSKG